MEKETKTYTFCVNGMHCPSCVVFIEEELNKADSVSSVEASLASRTVSITGDFLHEPSVLSEILTEYVSKGGYTLTLERKDARSAKDFIYALPIAVAFLVGFFLLQKAGIVNVLGVGAITYSTAILVGLVASLSTCLAVVGGVALSLSVGYAKTGRVWKPQAMFHVGRFLGFFVLGGVLGLIGGAFPLGPLSGFVLTLLASFAMLIIGLNLLDILRVSLRMPAFLSKTILKNEKTHALGPLALGLLTFFLPCGFTQAMQIYALSTGSFLTGAFTMFAFALGTFPVLALLSFGAWSVEGKSWKGVFFKTAGLVLLLLSAFNIWSALAGQGLVPPIGF